LGGKKRGEFFVEGKQGVLGEGDVEQGRKPESSYLGGWIGTVEPMAGTKEKHKACTLWAKNSGVGEKRAKKIPGSRYTTRGKGEECGGWKDKGLRTREVPPHGERGGGTRTNRVLELN